MNKYKRLRLLASMSTREAAKRIGVTNATITHWETGRTRPRSLRLQKVADAYGCSVADLLDDDAPKGG